MPKLAIIDQYVSAGGVERFVHGLVGGMLEQSEFQNWDVTIILNRFNTAGNDVRWPEHLAGSNLQLRYLFDGKWGKYIRRIVEPGRIWGIPGTGTIRSGLFLLVARLWIELECRRRRYDVVYFPGPYLIGCPNIPMPLVTTMHDFNWKHKHLHSVSFLGSQLLELQIPGWLRKCFRAVVSSEFIAGELKYFYPSFEGKVRTVRVGTPSANLIPTDAQLQAYKVNAELPPQFLLTVGWIMPHKNQKVLFEALQELRNRGIKIPIVFTGPNSAKLCPSIKEPKPEYIEETIQLADRLGLKYGLDYIGLGYVSDFDLDCLYRLSKALLAPALYEAGSFPILEAIRARCPVLCSRIPPYIEQDNLLGNNLWLFDPNDGTSIAETVAQVLSNTELAADRAKKAMEMLRENYDWGKTATGYLDIFRGALEKY